VQKNEYYRFLTLLGVYSTYLGFESGVYNTYLGFRTLMLRALARVSNLGGYST